MLINSTINTTTNEPEFIYDEISLRSHRNELMDIKNSLIDLFQNKSISDIQKKELSGPLINKVQKIDGKALKMINRIDSVLSGESKINHFLKSICFTMDPPTQEIEKLQKEIEHLNYLQDSKANAGMEFIYDYDEFVLRLPEDEKKRIEDYILDPSICSQIENLLNEGDWEGIGNFLISNDDRIRTLEDLTFHGLALAREGTISINQYSTFMLYLSACKQHGVKNVQILPIFNGKEVNQKVAQLIDQTMIDGRNYFAGYRQKLGKKHRMQMENFYLTLQLAPKSEQYLFMIPDLSGHYILKKNPPEILSISQVINCSIGPNQFGRIKKIKKGKMQRLVASIDIMQSYLDVTRPYGLRIRPVWGKSNEMQIRNNGLSNERDMQIPYLPHPTDLIPDTADEDLVPDPYDMTYHDFYHAMTCSRIPPNTQKAIIRMADLFTDEKLSTLKIKGEEKEKIISKFVEFFRSGLIDMEHKFYEDSPLFLWEKTIVVFYSFKKSLYPKGQKPTAGFKLMARFIRNTIENDLKRNSQEWTKLGIRKRDWVEFRYHFQ